MNRKETTEFLSNLLEKKLCVDGALYAKEVVLDYGTKYMRRVDFLSFVPAHQMTVSGIERGMFSAYEVKSSKADFNSGFGRNAVGDENWFLMTADTWNRIKTEYSVPAFGVLVPIPADIRLNTNAAAEWILHPAPYSPAREYHFQKVAQTHRAVRTRSVQELLFLMLRAKHH